MHETTLSEIVQGTANAPIGPKVRTFSTEIRQVS